MLARLRHHGFVGRHHQHHRVDTRRAREHVAHEALVPRHVDKRHMDIADRPVRKAQIDRDAARFLFLQTVGIDAGERAYQRALAVIDVAGGADDEQHQWP